MSSYRGLRRNLRDKEQIDETELKLTTSESLDMLYIEFHLKLYNIHSNSYAKFSTKRT